MTYWNNDLASLLLFLPGILGLPGWWFYRRHQILDAALEESRRHYQQLFDTQPTGILMLDDSHRVTACNPAACHMLGMDRDDLLGLRCDKPPWDIIDQDHNDLPTSEYPPIVTLRTNTPIHGAVIGLRHKHRAIQWLMVSTHPLSRLKTTKAYAVVTSFTDISHERETQEKLRIAASVFEHAISGIVITDREGIIQDVNSAFCSITGYSRNEVIGRNTKLLASGKHTPEFYTEMWNKLLACGHWSGKITNRKQNGELYTQHLSITAIRDQQQQIEYFIGSFTESRPSEAHGQQISQVGHHDVLTGLPNRVILIDRLQQAIQRAQWQQDILAVAYIDLDDFRLLNERYDRPTGDRIIEELFHRIHAALREHDTLVRLEGDDFALILTELHSNHECNAILTRLVEVIEQPLVIHDQELILYSSIGASLYPQREDIDAEQLLRQAEQALYQAKISGKRQLKFFDTHQESQRIQQQRHIKRIQTALSQCELELHFQPQVDLQDFRVVGAEALLRWRHDDILEAPGTFLPQIEHHSIMSHIDRWTLERAIQQSIVWDHEGRYWNISVNISAISLRNSEFVQTLASLLKQYPEMNPSRLTLEVLETTALLDLSNTAAIIRDCMKMKVQFALDDFGTGYSTLSYLKHLPARELKIDRSFVQDMTDSPEDLSILDGVIGLATAFSRTIVAEGLETEAQGIMLRRLGCHRAQGFGIAPPMPASDFPEWADSWQPCTAWRDVRPLHRRDFPVLKGIVEHREWMRSIADYLNGTVRGRPIVDSHDCNLGQWLYNDGLHDYHHLSIYDEILELHQRLHDVARRTIPSDPPPMGHTAANDPLKELQTLSDLLIKSMDKLMDTIC